MTRTAFAAAACAALLIAGPALAQQKPSQATIEAYVKSTFGKASPEWVARITPDESLAVCNATRNNVTSAQSEAIIKRELAKEVSYGTLGPSLTAYGKDRKYDAEAMKDAYTKIYNSMAVVPCSNMPRFGTNKVLDEQQIKDVMAYLFDPESPVNK